MQDALRGDEGDIEEEVGFAPIGFDESPGDWRLTRQEFLRLNREPVVDAIEFCNQLIEFVKEVPGEYWKWSKAANGWSYSARFFNASRPGWHDRIMELWGTFPNILKAYDFDIVSGDMLIWRPKKDYKPVGRQKGRYRPARKFSASSEK